MTNPTKKTDETSHAPVLVRDLPVRIFHWSLVVAVTMAALTGFLGEENWLAVHVWAGYAIAILLAFRVLWGFAGGRYSRLSAYPLSPRATIAHLRNLLAGDSPLVAGHNPAGAWMIVTLMALLFGLTVSGIATLGGEEDLGPFRAFVSYRLGDAAGELHEALAWLLLAAIGGHLAGVFVETRILGHPLLAAMTRGTMPAPPAVAEKGRFALRGLLVFAIAFGSLAAAYSALAATPDGRWRRVDYITAYESNCGDCHHAHHPSLRTSGMWKRMIRDLEDHFGEDATLDDKAKTEILAFLRANDATTFDTEAANRIGRAPSPDGRISSTAFWKKRHEAIAADVFRRDAVGSKANCDACHADARTGRFDDVAIRIPEEKGDSR